MTTEQDLPTNDPIDSSKASTLIENHQGTFRVYIPNIELDAKKDPLRFQLTLRKLVTPMEDGTVIESITIDNQSPKLQQARQEAKELRLLPERGRIRPLLTILDKNIQYAFPWVMEELAKRDPERAAWVEKFTGLNTSSSPLTLSQVVDAGYGVCRHLTVVLLTLAKEAGLAGAHLTYHPRDDDKNGNITNVIRRDNGRPLFRSVGVGETFDIAHTWIEISMSNGSWIPVDPTPKLIGDTPEGLETFRDANYSVDLNSVVFAEGLPIDVYGAPQPSLQFRAAESERTGSFYIGAIRKHVIKSAQISENELFPSGPAELVYTRYQGPLDFHLKTRPTYKGTHAEIVNVAI